MKQFRFNRFQATSDDDERGPFRDCIKKTSDLFNKVILPSLEAAATDDFPQWNNPKAALTGDSGLTSSRDDRDLFQLLNSVEENVKNTCAEVEKSVKNRKKEPELDDDTLRILRQTVLTAVCTRDKIIQAIEEFKVEILGHPINIVLAAFLMDLSNQNTVTKVGIYDYAFRYGVPRSAKSFANSFPYDYLTAVYMIGYDSVVRMRTQKPTVDHFIKAEPSSLGVFTQRAYSDIEKVDAHMFSCQFII